MDRVYGQRAELGRKGWSQNGYGMMVMITVMVAVMLMVMVTVNDDDRNGGGGDADGEGGDNADDEGNHLTDTLCVRPMCRMVGFLPVVMTCMVASLSSMNSTGMGFD